jgi:uncharacterized protein with von Willebrand factor type A (vWA) domain
MPLRYITQSQTFQQSVELLGLGLAAVVAFLNNLLDEQSFDRLTGRHGALFFMAVALILFWNQNRVNAKRQAEHLIQAEKREDERRKAEEAARKEENAARELRHKEAMAVQEKALAGVHALAAEGIKAQLRASGAMERVDATMKAQTNEICERLEKIELSVNKCPKI